MARMISELNKPADIMASADFKVVDKALIPKRADWNIRFASNQLVLCYTDQSRYAGEVNHSNWYEILGREDVGWGHSDPNLDPCGYRSLMVLQLAEKYYNTPSLYDRLIANRPQKNIRPKSVEHARLFTAPPPGGFYFQDQQSRGIFRRGGGRIQSSIPIHPDHQQTAYHRPHHWASGFFKRCAEEYPLHLKDRRITPANCCLFVHRFIHRAASFCGNGTCGD